MARENQRQAKKAADEAKREAEVLPLEGQIKDMIETELKHIRRLEEFLAEIEGIREELNAGKISSETATKIIRDISARILGTPAQ